MALHAGKATMNVATTQPAKALSPSELTVLKLKLNMGGDLLL